LAVIIEVWKTVQRFWNFILHTIANEMRPIPEAVQLSLHNWPASMRLKVQATASGTAVYCTRNRGHSYELPYSH